MSTATMMPSVPPPAEQSDKARLLKKLLAVMQECGYIKKDKRNEFHKYTYASEAAIKQRLHESLTKHGLLFTASAIDFADRPVTVGKEQKTESVTVVTVVFEFHDVETGASIGGQFYGSGIDGADKGIYKAYTGAIKYIMTTWFLIPTGDDPEAEHERKKGRVREPEPEGVQRNTPEQQRDFAQQRIEQVRAAAQPVTPIQPSRPVSAGAQRLQEIQNSFDPAKWKSTVLPAFKTIKLRMIDLRGEEIATNEYRRILGLFEAEKATDFEGRIPAARTCFGMLWEKVTEWEPKAE